MSVLGPPSVGRIDSAVAVVGQESRYEGDSVAIAGLWRRLVFWGFDLLYHQLAFTYDLVADIVSFGQWAGWRRTVIPFLVEGPILDLAFGTGGLLADMRSVGLDAVGIDLSAYMCRVAGRRLRGTRGAMSLTLGRSQRLPFGDGTYGNVVATFPAEFILSDDTIRSVARVLRPGGRFLVVPKGYLKGPAILRKVVDAAYRVTGQNGWQEDSLARRLEAGGFAVRFLPVTAEDATSLLFVADRI